MNQVYVLNKEVYNGAYSWVSIIDIFSNLDSLLIAQGILEKNNYDPDVTYFYSSYFLK